MSGVYHFRHYWDGTGGRGDLDDYDDGRPSASDLAEEQWEEDRRRNYPRGYGPAWGDEVEDDPAYIDPDLASLEHVDPDRFLPENVVREAKRTMKQAAKVTRQVGDRVVDPLSFDGYGTIVELRRSEPLFASGQPRRGTGGEQYAVVEFTRPRRNGLRVIPGQHETFRRTIHVNDLVGENDPEEDYW